MKKFLLVFVLGASLPAFAQSKITVTSAGDSRPIAGAEVLCKDKALGKTDSRGTLSFRTKCRSVDVQAAGHYPEQVVVDVRMEAILSKIDPKQQNIEAVVIDDKSDPRALEILQKVNEKYAFNAPQSLDSYAYKSYEKISLDLDRDSIADYSRFLEERLDSLQTLPLTQQKKKEKKDSLERLNVMKLREDSQLFLWERATQFLYSQKYGEKITVLDNRVSGLQQPIYEMMSLRSNRNRVPREVRKENRALYRYFLTDSLEIDGRKNYVIRFRQVNFKQTAGKRRFNGYLYVDAESYGLKKLESQSKVRSEGNITSIWTQQNGKWFLLREDFRFKVGNTAFDLPVAIAEKKKKKKFGNYVYLKADYFDIQSPAQADKKEFSGYSMEVKNSDGATLAQYRTDSLTAREKMTYVKIDSVGKKYKLDAKIGGLTGLLRGNLRVGVVDFDVLRFAQYNRYEGLRLGAGIKLNEKFNPYFSPDAYVGYGFKDHTWKYGVGFDLKTTLKKTSFFRAEYYDDVTAAGRFSEELWNFRMKIMNAGIDLFNERFYHYRGFALSYENDLSNAFTAKIALKRDNEEAEFPYAFGTLGSDFTNAAAKISLKFAPRSKNIMTPGGKFTYEDAYPEFYFNYEQALNALGGTLSYSRFDFLAQHVFKTKAGTTGARVYSGLVTGDAPIWHHFAMNGLGSGKSGLNYNLTSYLGFATMEGGKYYNDKFAGFYLMQRLPFYYRTFGKNTSSFDLLYRGIIGNMEKPELHHFTFEKLDHLYQEVGFEANRFLGTPFNLGFFYRVGHYHAGDFMQNFAVQLKLNVLGF